MRNSSSFHYSAINWFCIALFAIFVNPGFGAQQSEIKPVTLDINVVEKNGRFVTGLGKDEFSIYEDGIKKQIDSFDTKDHPFSLGLVIDSSGSMRDKLGMVGTTLATTISLLGQNDEAFIAQFKMEPELVEAFTNDRQKLARSLSEIYSAGGTSLLDATIATTDYAEDNGKHQRKALIFVTDGLERNSASKEKEVITTLKESQVQAYFIYLPTEDGDSSGLFRKTSSAQGKDLIIRLAEASGGEAFFLKKVAEAPSVAAGIIENLRRQYRIGYKSNNPKQGGDWRKLKVEILPKPDRKLTVITRQGYFAPGHVTEKEKRKPKQKEKKK